jgi:hypothetical protein
LEGAIRVASRISAFGTAIVGRKRSDDERIAYRRVKAGIRSRGRGAVSWEASFSGKFRDETGYATAPVTMRNARERESDLQFRGRFDARNGRGVRCRARLDYLFAGSGNPAGAALLLGIGLSSRRVDASVQAVGHSLPPGRAAYVTRPGVGSFELFSGLYGTGSDLSMRVRFALGGGVSIVVYNGSNGSATRVYLSLEMRR